MRRITVVLAAMAATVTALALPAVSAGGKNKDQVVGKATNLFAGLGPMELKVKKGRSDGDGGNPKGSIRAEGDINGDAPAGKFQFQGDITCLRAEDNRVAIKYRFEQADGDSGEPFEGGGVQIYIEDNGAKKKKADRVSFDPPQTAGAFEGGEDSCSDPDTPAQPYDEVEKGNYTLINARPRNG